MNELKLNINRSIDSELTHSGYELVDLIPIPDSSDKARRNRSLQEIIKDFDEINMNSDFKTYVLQVRKTVQKNKEKQEQTIDGIYLPNGKLNAKFLFNNANLLFEAGDAENAKKIFSTLIKNGELMGDSLLGLARCLQSENKIDEALKKYEDSILYQPKLETFKFYTDLLIKLEKFKTAADVLERTLLSNELTPKNRIELLLKSVEVLKTCNDPVKAELKLKKILELDPNHMDALLKYGEIFIDKNNADEALRCFNLVLRQTPENAMALYGLGRSTLILGDKERALDLFIQSLDKNIHNAKALFHMIKIAYELKVYDQTYSVLKKYIDHTPFNAHLLYTQAGLEFHLALYPEAIKTLRQILSMKPDHVEAKNLLSIIEKRM